MNPPFENKYGCIEIVSNVLDSVKRADYLCIYNAKQKIENKHKQST